MEAVLVVALIGLVAAVCLPMVTGYLGEAKLEMAAQDAADAIGFAQATSARTQRVFRVAFNPDAQTMTVYYLDPVADPEAGPVVAVNPCDKRPYSRRYSEDGVALVSAGFKYAGGEVTPFVEFDQHGIARRSPSGALLASGTVRLALGGSGRIIQVRPNGTVAVQ